MEKKEKITGDWSRCGWNCNNQQNNNVSKKPSYTGGWSGTFAKEENALYKKSETVENQKK